MTSSCTGIGLLATSSIYQLYNNVWIQLGEDIDYSGVSVSLSSDGSRVAIAARNNDNDAGTNAGHVPMERSVFHRFNFGDECVDYIRHPIFLIVCMGKPVWYV